jgi:hypothetical protein
MMSIRLVHAVVLAAVAGALIDGGVRTWLHDDALPSAHPAPVVAAPPAPAPVAAAVPVPVPPPRVDETAQQPTARPDDAVPPEDNPPEAEDDAGARKQTLRERFSAWHRSPAGIETEIAAIDLSIAKLRDKRAKLEADLKKAGTR